MTPEEVEKTTIDNAIAIKELATIASQTSKDVDKMVSHLDELIPVHTKLSTLSDKIYELRKILYGTIVIAIGFGSWVTLAHFENAEKINNNKNQIQYLKGRIK